MVCKTSSSALAERPRDAYNSAAGSFHTKKLCNKLHSIKVEFYVKTKKSLFGPPFGGPRGNVRTPSTPCFRKKTPTHIVGYKLRNSCLILIIFDINIPDII